MKTATYCFPFGGQGLDQFYSIKKRWSLSRHTSQGCRHHGRGNTPGCKRSSSSAENTHMKSLLMQLKSHLVIPCLPGRPSSRRTLVGGLSLQPWRWWLVNPLSTQRKQTKNDTTPMNPHVLYAAPSVTHCKVFQVFTWLTEPGPTAITVACSTLPWDFSGSMMPPFVTVSAVKRSTSTRSNNGRNFLKACERETTMRGT